MPDLGTLTAPTQTALHDYLTADPDSPAEAAAWRAYQVALDHEVIESVPAFAVASA